MPAQHLVALEELVDGEVRPARRAHARTTRPGRRSATPHSCRSALADRSKHTTTALRWRAAPAASKAASSALPGSDISMDAYRQPSPTPVLAAQDRSDSGEFVGAQRVQRVRHRTKQPHSARRRMPVAPTATRAARVKPSQARRRSARGRIPAGSGDRTPSPRACLVITRPALAGAAGAAELTPPALDLPADPLRRGCRSPAAVSSAPRRVR